MEPIVNNYEPFKPKGEVNPQGQDVPSNADAGLEGIDLQGLIKWAKARNSTFEKWFKPKLDLLKRLHTLWVNSKDATGKNLALPVAYGIVEAVNARVAANIIQRPKYVDAVAQVPQDGEGNEAQANVEDFVNQKLKIELRRVEKGKSAIKTAITDSFTIFRSLWTNKIIDEVKPIYEVNPLTGEQVLVGEERIQRQVGAWTFEVKDPALIAWEPTIGTAIQNSPWVRERSHMSFNDLKKWEKEGRIWNVDVLKTIIPSGVSGSDKDDWEKAMRKSEGDTTWTYTCADEKKYQVDEWYADVPKGDDVIRAHFFIVESEHVIFFEENPLIPARVPYYSCPLILKPHNVMGIGLLEPVEGLLNETNGYAQKQGAVVNSLSNATIFVDATAGITSKALFNKLGGIIPVDDVKGIREWERNPSPVNIVQGYVQFLIGMIRESTGANEQFQGIDGADTATEFAGLQAAAGSRFADVVETLNQGFIENLAEECYLSYRQFGSDEDMVVHPTSIEIPAKRITRAELAGEYRFEALSSVTEQYKGKQVADDTAFIAEMAQANMQGVFGMRRYNLEKHITEISLPLRNQKNGASWFVDAPPPMMPPMPGMPGPEGTMPPEGMAPEPTPEPPMPLEAQG